MLGLLPSCVGIPKRSSAVGAGTKTKAGRSSVRNAEIFCASNYAGACLIKALGFFKSRSFSFFYLGVV